MKLPHLLLLFLGSFSVIQVRSKSSSSSKSSRTPRAGQPFYLYTQANRARSTDCLGVNAEGHACIDTDNRVKFFYTSAYQLEAEDSLGERSGDCLAFVSSDRPLELVSCDRDESNQKWLFVRVPSDDGDAEYMIMHMSSGKIIEYDGSDALYLGMGSRPRSSRASSQDLFVVNSGLFFNME